MSSLSDPVHEDDKAENGHYVDVEQFWTFETVQAFGYLKQYEDSNQIPQGTNW